MKRWSETTWLIIAGAAALVLVVLFRRPNLALQTVGDITPSFNLSMPAGVSETSVGGDSAGQPEAYQPTGFKKPSTWADWLRVNAALATGDL